MSANWSEVPVTARSNGVFTCHRGTRMALYRCWAFSADRCTETSGPGWTATVITRQEIERGSLQPPLPPLSPLSPLPISPLTSSLSSPPLPLFPALPNPLIFLSFRLPLSPSPPLSFRSIPFSTALLHSTSSLSPRAAPLTRSALIFDVGAKVVMSSRKA